MSDETLIFSSWAERLREGYLSGEASQFLLHSNTGDLVPWEEGGKLEYVTLIEFLTRFLSRTKELVVFYNLSEGLRFTKAEMRETFIRRITIHRRAKREEDWSGVIPASPSRVLGLLGEFIGVQSQRAAVIIDYLETLTPEGDIGYLSSEDRACLVAVQDWSRDPVLLTSDNIVVLIAENLMEVNRKIRSMPQLMTIEVGLPDYGERLKFINHVASRFPVQGLAPNLMAEMTAGLTRIQIEGIFKQAKESRTAVSMEGVGRKKKEVIERECMGLVEVIEPRHGFEALGGMPEIKRTLAGVADAIRKGESRRAPMGILLVGPMGTGKSFLAEAFARESGLTYIKFKSFREKWVGATEANLERILSIVQALGYVLVVIDEADRNLGTGDREGDSGTESRVIARLKEFMSDGGHRGKIVFMVLTNRPDKLDTDLKRPGRLDLKIPMFYPETPEQRREIVEAVARKNGFVLDRAAEALAAAAERTKGYSGADLEGLMVAADRLASESGSAAISGAHLERALGDFIPSRDNYYIEYMEVLSVFEASSKNLLPERYRNIGNQELQERIQFLRARMEK
ncbi:MAG TPA: AAA family ATPase [bacterium]|nr:AAA family ATPase [bacterium]